MGQPRDVLCPVSMIMRACLISARGPLPSGSSTAARVPGGTRLQTAVAGTACRARYRHATGLWEPMSANLGQGIRDARQGDAKQVGAAV